MDEYCGVPRARESPDPRELLDLDTEFDGSSTDNSLDLHFGFCRLHDFYNSRSCCQCCPWEIGTVLRRLLRLSTPDQRTICVETENRVWAGSFGLGFRE